MQSITSKKTWHLDGLLRETESIFFLSSQVQWNHSISDSLALITMEYFLEVLYWHVVSGSNYKAAKGQTARWNNLILDYVR